MGFHVCEFCPNKTTKNLFQKTSSGDVNLTFINGHRWVMPDMILHYVADHGWAPPQEFIDDVMNGELADSGRRQTRALNIGEVMQGEKIGYLAGAFKQGVVPKGFIERLEYLMQRAGSMGNRVQTKRLSTYR